MRVAVPHVSFSLVAALALGAGCASVDPVLDRPASGAYRIPGRAPDPMPSSAEEGALAYAVDPGHDAGYDLDAAVARGEARITIVVTNRGRAPLRYDLRRLALTGAGGEPLQLAGLQEDPSRRPTREERSAEDYREGVREVLRGEKLSVTRRYRVANTEHAARSLATLELSDELTAGDAAVPVELHLERAR